jgi:hypothetical protein
MPQPIMRSCSRVDQTGTRDVKERSEIDSCDLCLLLQEVTTLGGRETRGEEFQTKGRLGV